MRVGFEQETSSPEVSQTCRRALCASGENHQTNSVGPSPFRATPAAPAELTLLGSCPDSCYCSSYEWVHEGIQMQDQSRAKIVDGFVLEGTASTGVPIYTFGRGVDPRTMTRSHTAAMKNAHRLPLNP